MSKVAAALKAEMIRLARKEIKAPTSHTKKMVIEHRSAIAALRRDVSALQKRLVFLERAARAVRHDGVERQDDTKSVRYSAKSLRAQRERLKLSAQDFGALLGVSGQSVYNWESEKARPRRAQLPKIAALRSVGVREARERLERLT